MKIATFESAYEILKRFFELEKENHRLRGLIVEAERKADFYMGDDAPPQDACPWCFCTYGNDLSIIVHDMDCSAA